jgi:hypothetical protein
MFRLIRLVILCMIAFVLGVFYERQNVHTACTALGGEMINGLCLGQAGQ